MANEPADVLIIGAGASGGVVARRLAEAGFRVVCLEQGDWHDRAGYRGAELDWELGHDPAARLAVLDRDEPEHHAARLLMVVAGHCTDRDVRERLGYPDQVAKPVDAWPYPACLEEGPIAPVLAPEVPA